MSPTIDRNLWPTEFLFLCLKKRLTFKLKNSKKKFNALSYYTDSVLLSILSIRILLDGSKNCILKTYKRVLKLIKTEPENKSNNHHHLIAANNRYTYKNSVFTIRFELKF